MNPKTIAPITVADLRRMRQPDAEIILFDILNPVIHGGATLPLGITGEAGLGKTTQGLDYISALLCARGFQKDKLPDNCTAKMLKETLYSWTLKPGRRVIPCDESHAGFSDSFWEEFKKLIRDDCQPVEFETKDADGKAVSAVFIPANHVFIFATNFGMESGGNNHKGAINRRLLPIPFLPYREHDKRAIWEEKAAIHKLPYSSESASLALRCVISNGGEIEKQVSRLASIAHGSGNFLNFGDAWQMQSALMRAGYFQQGLTANHIAVLEYIAIESRGRQVNEIEKCATKGTCPLAILSHLVSMGFAITTGGGRKGATEKGRAYLESHKTFMDTYKEEYAIAALPIPEWKAALLSAIAEEEAEKAAKADKKRKNKKAA